MTDTNESGHDDSTDYQTKTRDAEKEAFGDESIGYPANRTDANDELLRERAAAGDEEAIGKLAGWDVSKDESGGLVEAFEDSDEDVPEWALTLAEAVETNATMLEELADGDESEKASPFTR